MLTVQGLHLWRGDRHVLRGVSFRRSSPARCVLLTGKNGAGKTTLMRAIAGLLDPEEGQVLVARRAGASASRRFPFRHRLSRA